MFYRVTVKDNGSGMPFEDVPNMFGRVLAGTKYGVKQARGKFGLGAKMVGVNRVPRTLYLSNIKRSDRL